MKKLFTVFGPGRVAISHHASRHSAATARSALNRKLINPKDRSYWIGRGPDHWGYDEPTPYRRRQDYIWATHGTDVVAKDVGATSWLDWHVSRDLTEDVSHV